MRLRYHLMKNLFPNTKMKINCIIIDDEDEAREGLRLLLESDSHINVLAECADGLQAIESINKYKPELILLDIQMPQANGFEVLNNIKVPMPEVIFITAYDQFALRAFEVHALDYLLKPFSDDRFFEALEHAKKKLAVQTTKQSDTTMNIVKDAIANQKTTDQVMITPDNTKLILKANGKINFILKESIIWVEAYDYYIKIHVAEQYFLVRESMKNVLLKLGHSFVRIHKSSIVNIAFIKSLDKLVNNELKLALTNGQLLKVSRSYKADLTRILKVN